MKAQPPAQAQTNIQSQASIPARPTTQNRPENFAVPAFAPPLPEIVEAPEGNSDFLPPPTIKLPKRRLTLAETVRLGLEHNKDVVVLSFTPSIDATAVDTAMAPFDPVSGASAIGGKSDVQSRSLIQTFGAPSSTIQTDTFLPYQQPNNLYSRRKFYSGGEVMFGFSTNYQNFFPVGPQLLVNPGWASALNFRYDQPLFRGRGEEVQSAPIRIAQAKQNQSRYDFMAEIRGLTRDIEVAYWELAATAALSKRTRDSWLVEKRCSTTN